MITDTKKTRASKRAYSKIEQIYFKNVLGIFKKWEKADETKKKVLEEVLRDIHEVEISELTHIVDVFARQKHIRMRVEAIMEKPKCCYGCPMNFMPSNPHSNYFCLWIEKMERGKIQAVTTPYMTEGNANPNCPIIEVEVD